MHNLARCIGQIPDFRCGANVEVGLIWPAHVTQRTYVLAPYKDLGTSELLDGLWQRAGWVY